MLKIERAEWVINPPPEISLENKHFGIFIMRCVVDKDNVNICITRPTFQDFFSNNKSEKEIISIFESNQEFEDIVSKKLKDGNFIDQSRKGSDIKLVEINPEDFSKKDYRRI